MPRCVQVQPRMPKHTLVSMLRPPHVLLPLRLGYAVRGTDQACMARPCLHIGIGEELHNDHEQVFRQVAPAPGPARLAHRRAAEGYLQRSDT